MKVPDHLPYCRRGHLLSSPPEYFWAHHESIFDALLHLDAVLHVDALLRYDSLFHLDSLLHSDALLYLDALLPI